MEKKDKILILGHTGMVGATLLEKLTREGYPNVFKASKSSGWDLTDQHEVFDLFYLIKPKFVFNCAAIVGGIQYNIDYPFDMIYGNTQIQNNIVKNCIEHNVEKAVFLGSSCIYPKDYSTVLKEDHLLKDKPEETNFSYAIAKIQGLSLCAAANEQFPDRTKFISLMPCNLYGSKDTFDLDKSHVISALIKKICDAKINGDLIVEIWGSGKQKREFLNAEDLADCMIWSIGNIDPKEGFYNVGAGEDISIEDLTLLIADLVEYKGGFWFNTDKPDGMMKKLMDSSKINKKGWKPKTPLEVGIKKVIKSYMLRQQH